MSTIEATPEEWAYAAGFFDGDGSIWTSQRKSEYLADLGVSIMNTNREVIDWMHDTFNFPSRARVWKPLPSGKLAHNIRTTNRDYIPTFLEGMLPYLIVKRERAELAIQICRNTPRWTKVTPQTRNLLDRLKVLNRKGSRRPQVDP